MEQLLKAVPHYLQMRKALAEDKELANNPFALLDLVETIVTDPSKKFGYKTAINEAIEASKQHH